MFRTNEEKIGRIEELLNRRRFANKEVEMYESFLKKVKTDSIHSITVDFGAFGKELLPSICGDGLISSVKADLDRTNLELMEIEKELDDILNIPADINKQAKN